MFTGLIRDIGTIRSIDKKGDWVVTIGTALNCGPMAIGASIACSGCCLTIIEKGADWFRVQVSQETLSKTTIALWIEGDRINLEPSLRIGDELGGHLVSGHVDGLVRIIDVTQAADSYILTIHLPAEFARYIAPKGSVTLDGISLTVNQVRKDSFTVNIIPHTWTNTTLGFKTTGDDLHIEIDMLARYVARMLGTREAA